MVIILTSLPAAFLYLSGRQFSFRASTLKSGLMFCAYLVDCQAWLKLDADDFKQKLNRTANICNTKQIWSCSLSNNWDV